MSFFEGLPFLAGVGTATTFLEAAVVVFLIFFYWSFADAETLAFFTTAFAIGFAYAFFCNPFFALVTGVTATLRFLAMIDNL